MVAHWAITDPLAAIVAHAEIVVRRWRAVRDAVHIGPATARTAAVLRHTPPFWLTHGVDKATDVTQDISSNAIPPPPTKQAEVESDCDTTAATAALDKAALLLLPA